MKLNGNNLKLAIQKNGRLTDPTIDLLRKIGINFDTYGKQLFAQARNFDLDILFVRDNDIPEYVKDGVCDLGIVGLNIVKEKNVAIKKGEKLGFGKCSLCLAVPEKSPIKNIEDLRGKTIATSYPYTLKKYCCEKKLTTKIVEISGSVEIAPILNVADAICDLVSTGTTLKTNGLRILETVLVSEAVLIQKKQLSERKQKLVSKLLLRIRSNKKAQNKKYIMLNAPKRELKTIKSIIPGLKSPTIMPLADPEMIAIHSVVPENIFWDVIERLKNAGARDILVTPIEQIIH